MEYSFLPVFGRFRRFAVNLAKLIKGAFRAWLFRVPGARVTRTVDRRKHSWDDRVEFREHLDKSYVFQSEEPFDPGVVLPHFFADKHLLVLQNAVFDSTFGIHYLNSVGVAESTPWRPAKLFRRNALRLLFARKIQTDAHVVFLSERRWNYYHWLIEDLPSLLYIRGKFADLQVYVGANAPGFVEKTLRHYGISFCLCRGLISAQKTVLVTRGPSDTGWPHRWDVGQIRAHEEQRTEKVLPQKKIYVSRRLSSRSPRYEKELETGLEALGFEMLFLEEMAFEDQKFAFFEASVVVAPHGAGLANLVFSRPGTRVVELLDPIRINQCYERLCRICDLEYEGLRVQDNESVEAVLHQLKEAIEFDGGIKTS